jgi:ADP-ribosylglycohydrolase
VPDLPSPLPNSYWVEPGRILAGEYPAGRSEEETTERLKRLLDAGIDCFFDLTEPGECTPYENFLPSPDSRLPVRYLRLPIPDHGLPRSTEQMQEILDELDAALAEGRRIYLHCRAGIGRTNLVAGCWYAHSGVDGDAALARLNERWQGSARSQSWPSVPETDAQHEFVRDWREPRRREVIASDTNVPSAMSAADLRNRVRGMLLGLATAEAREHAAHDLPTGAWADKTAMALCLAESFVACSGHDAADQVQRYQSWQRDGHWSATGVAAGASAATQRALATARWTGNPYAGSHDPAAASAEPLARIGPAVAWHYADAHAAIEAAVQSARVTHQAPLTLDAVRYLSALLGGALAGADKAALLTPMYGPPGFWDTIPLKPRVRKVADGSWRKRKSRRLVVGSSAAASALAAALIAFRAGQDLRDCIERAAGGGGDEPMVTAIVGQLAGAHYGASSLPDDWLDRLARRAEIEAVADALHDGARRNAGRA